MTMNNNGKILLPNGSYQERLYDNALVMDSEYQKRYYELLSDNSRAGIILLFVLGHMNENGEVVASYEEILDYLKAKSIKYSYATAKRSVKIIKERYADLVKIDRYKGKNRYLVESGRCFISKKGAAAR